MSLPWSNQCLWTLAHADDLDGIPSNSCSGDSAASRVAASPSWRRATARPTTGSGEMARRCVQYGRSLGRRDRMALGDPAASTSYLRCDPENGSLARLLGRPAVGVPAMRLNGMRSAHSSHCAAVGQTATSLVARTGIAAADIVRPTINSFGKASRLRR